MMEARCRLRAEALDDGQLAGELPLVAQADCAAEQLTFSV